MDSDEQRKEWERMKYDADLGHKATVEREELPKAEIIASCNHALNEIGIAIGQSDPKNKGMRYVGSAAVHIFISDALVDNSGRSLMSFYSQTKPLHKCPREVAASAGQDLHRAIAQRFGESPGKKRSGF